MGWNEDLASCTWMFPEVTSRGAVLIAPSVVDLGLTFSLTMLVVRETINSSSPSYLLFYAEL